LVPELRENLLLYSSHLPLGVPNGLVIHHTTSNSFFLAPLPGIEEEEAPTSTTLSHVNLAPSSYFLAPLPGKSGRPLQGEFSDAHPLLCYYFALLYLFYLHRFISKTQKIRILGS
jgi:hypothetical protein